MVEIYSEMSSMSVKEGGEPAWGINAVWNAAAKNSCGYKNDGSSSRWTSHNGASMKYSEAESMCQPAATSKEDARGSNEEEGRQDGDQRQEEADVDRVDLPMDINLEQLASKNKVSERRSPRWFRLDSEDTENGSRSTTSGRPSESPACAQISTSRSSRTMIGHKQLP